MTKLGFLTTFLVGMIVLSIISIFVFRSPTPLPPPVVSPSVNIPVDVTPEAEFNKAFTLALSKKVIFSDGLSLGVKEINDSRCKPDVQCFWAGELGVTLSLLDGNFKNAGEVRLGTVNNKSVTFNNYIFSLQSATEKDATLIVQQVTPAVSAKCYVGGCSSQVCSDQEGAISTCEWKQEYACFKTAKCERQQNGQCGWTQTSTLKACLSAS